jgi:sulfur carrier protein ThiS
MVTTVRNIHGLALVMNDEWWAADPESAIRDESTLYDLLDFVNRHRLSVTFHPNGHIVIKEQSTNVVAEDYGGSLLAAVREFIRIKRDL